MASRSAARRSLPARVWQGEVRLWITYWIWGVGGNMAFVALLGAVALGGPQPGAGVSAWLIWLLSLAWFAFVFGAIWRAAGRYPGPRALALLARAGVCLGIPRLAAEAVLLASS